MLIPGPHPPFRVATLAGGPGVSIQWCSHGVLPTPRVVLILGTQQVPQAGPEGLTTCRWSLWDRRTDADSGEGQEVRVVEWEHPGGGRALPSQG